MTDGPENAAPPAGEEAPAGERPRRPKRRKVPRVVRRTLLYAAWVSATVLLAAEIVTSVRNLLS